MGRRAVHHDMGFTRDLALAVRATASARPGTARCPSWEGGVRAHLKWQIQVAPDCDVAPRCAWFTMRPRFSGFEGGSLLVPQQVDRIWATEATTICLEETVGVPRSETCGPVREPSVQFLSA